MRCSAEFARNIATHAFVIARRCLCSDPPLHQARVPNFSPQPIKPLFLVQLSVKCYEVVLIRRARWNMFLDYVDVDVERR